MLKTLITIKDPDGSSKNALWSLYERVFLWISEKHPDADFDEIDDKKFERVYLRNIALRSEAISESDLKNYKVSTCGFLRWCEMYSERRELQILQYTSNNSLCVAMWDLIVKKYVPNAVLTYKSINDSGSDCVTNRLEYVDTFYIKTPNTTKDKASRQDVAALLSKNYRGSFAEMLSSFRNNAPANVQISRWEILPISDAD